MKTFKPRTWRSLLVLASGCAALAASGAFDEPAPVAQVEPATLNGHPVTPPGFSWNDIFKGPR